MFPPKLFVKLDTQYHKNLFERVRIFRAGVRNVDEDHEEPRSCDPVPLAWTLWTGLSPSCVLRVHTRAWPSLSTRPSRRRNDKRPTDSLVQLKLTVNISLFFQLARSFSPPVFAGRIYECQGARKSFIFEANVIRESRVRASGRCECEWRTKTGGRGMFRPVDPRMIDR